MAPFYGLRGQKLHRAVAGIAGMGFLLFGCDFNPPRYVPAAILQLPHLDTTKVRPSRVVRRIAHKHLVAGVMGGLLTLPSFVETFPEIDTINTTGSLKSYNSTLQGML
jgi:hypothetical protein